MHRRLPIILVISMLALQASADTLKLANGDELNGEIVEWAVDHVVIDHPQLGEVRLSLEQLDLDTGTPPSRGLFGTTFLRSWNRNVDIGWTGRVGSTGETVYAGAKGGVIAFTKSLAREVAGRGINVNCVCPGPTDTPLFGSLPEKMRQALTRAIPFRRLARPEEVADAILFFASSRSDFITGQVLSVSGGLTMAG